MICVHLLHKHRVEYNSIHDSEASLYEHPCDLHVLTHIHTPLIQRLFWSSSAISSPGIKTKSIHPWGRNVSASAALDVHSHRCNRQNSCLLVGIERDRRFQIGGLTFLDYCFMCIWFYTFWKTPFSLQLKWLVGRRRENNKNTFWFYASN